MAESGKPTGASGSVRREFVLAGMLVLLLMIALIAFFTEQYNQGLRRDWASATIALDHEAKDLSRIARAAQEGAPPDFAALKASRERITQGLAALKSNEAGSVDMTAASKFPQQVTALEAAWSQTQPSLTAISSADGAFAGTSAALTQLRAGVAQASSVYEQVAEHQAMRGAPAGQILFSSGQLIRLQRLQILALQVLPLNRNTLEAINQLKTEAATFVSNTQSLAQAAASDESVVEMLGKATANFSTVSDAVAAIDAQSAVIAGLPEQLAKLGDSAGAFEKQLSGLSAALQDSEKNPLIPFIFYGSGIFAFILLLAFLMTTIRSTRERERMAEERDARQQAAILSLLDEITNLADGDLTVDVTVTEDFTGAIADSINYTVDTLRRLVGTINDTSVEIAGAATTTQDTAQRMSQASERQAREISTVATVLTQSSQSLTQVSGRAEELAQEAAASVQVAHNGAATVGRTIQGMAALREQIQETAKRIKRLGESSQEIGNIIEFINDIAEQTNTLALNASIQAAMAGESGRGFAVVADEVQRLAERAANATRQIETLVKTIQADTNEAIVSMERSTGTVVSGAKSAEEAGQALTRIESSSTELARLIQDIALAARAQSGQATKVSEQMQVIREIATQTSNSADKTASEVGELTALSEKLRASVSGFKLPHDSGMPMRLDYPSAA
jgi:twitching motility protein PilJ